jgi:hypothetical protein
MANLSQTAGNVKLVKGTSTQIGIAGESLTQGQPAYQVNGQWFRADANDGLVKSQASAIALTPAATGETVVLANGNAEINLGATLAVGEVYVVSATVGAIAPYADLVANDYVTILGVAKTTAILAFNPQATGIQKA